MDTLFHHILWPKIPKDLCTHFERFLIKKNIKILYFHKLPILAIIQSGGIKIAVSH